eukprot:m.111148 g.111148  ORF g.111148 m.111148 type:complete len:71 (-) comp9232_c2_seq1:553-765(-)
MRLTLERKGGKWGMGRKMATYGVMFETMYEREHFSSIFHHRQKATFFVMEMAELQALKMEHPQPCHQFSS